jgi:hypothetical protein
VRAAAQGGEDSHSGESSQPVEQEEAHESGIEPDESESGHGIGPSVPDPWTARLERVRDTLDRARRIQAWVDAREGRTHADAARWERVSRARISQIVKLLKLAPEIIEDIERPGRVGKVPGELELRQLAGLERKQQVQRYRDLLDLDEKLRPLPRSRQSRARDAGIQARGRGLAHHLARARHLRALVDSGRYSSISALAREEGISRSRVTHLLNLLDLHPAILAAIDVPLEQEPPVNEFDLRGIAVHLDKQRQLREWRALLRKRKAHGG